jgi:hypothetical protein
MPDHPVNQPGHSHDANVLRLFADGEAGTADRVHVQAMLDAGDGRAAQLSKQIECELQLRAAVARVMKADFAPHSLRSQVERSMAEVVDESPVLSRIEPAAVTRAERRRAPTWWLFASPQRANFVAVAAVLAMIAGAVLFGIFGRSIDDVPVQRVDVVGNAATYVDGEHTQCTTSPEYISKEATWPTAQEAVLGLTALLGVPTQVFDLSSLGYKFLGAGPCQVPLESEPSGHLIYRKMIDGRPGPMVSVFVAPVRGCCKGICSGLAPRQWVAAAAASCKRRVLYSTDGRLVFFLVCCDEGDLPAVAQAISQAPVSGSR